MAFSAPAFRFLFSARRLHDDCEDQCQEAYQEDIQTCIEQVQMVPLTGPILVRAAPGLNSTVNEAPRSDDVFRYWCENNCKSCKSNLRNCMDNCPKPDPEEACRNACFQEYKKGSYGMWSCFERCSP